MNIESFSVQNFFSLKNNQNNNVINPNFKAKENTQTEFKQTVNAKIALANYVIPKINTAFKGSFDKNTMSDEEFKNFIKTLSEIENELFSPSKNLTPDKLKLAENKLFKKAVFHMHIINLKFLKNQKNITKKFLTEEQLNDKEFNKSIKNFVSVFDDEQIDILNDVLENEKINKNQNIINAAVSKVLISFAPEQMEIAKETIDILQQISDNKQLCDNEDFLNSILFAQNKFSLDFIKTITDNEVLNKNSNIIKNLTKMAENIETNEQSEIAKEVVFNKNFTEDKTFMENIGDIIGALYMFNCDEQGCYYSCSENRAEILNKILSNEELYKDEKIIKNAVNFIKGIENSYQKKFIDKILSDKELSDDFIEVSGGLIRKIYDENDLNILNKMIDDIDKDTIKRIDNHQKKVMEHPELYINGEIEDDKKDKYIINNFFGRNYFSLASLISAFNDKTVNTLLRERLANAQEYLNTVSYFNENDLKLLKKLSNSTNANGKSFSEKEKIGFIDLINTYKQNNLGTKKIQTMADSGKVDIKELNKNLLEEIFIKCGIEEDISLIPKEKQMWDMKHIHLLSWEIQYGHKNYFKDMVRAAVLGDFKTYLQDTTNEYGKVNANTQKMFKQNNLDYKKWVDVPSYNNVYFQPGISKIETGITYIMETKPQLKDFMQKRFPDCIDKEGNFVIPEKYKTDTKNLNKLKKELLEETIKANMEMLLDNNAVKQWMKGKFPNYIKEDKFVIPKEYSDNTEEMLYFIKQLIQKDLITIFNRAEKNKYNPEKATEVDNTLTVQKNLSNCFKIFSRDKMYPNLTIKMWDRVPQKDIFQGNYSTCCIGMQRGHGNMMPHYLMNTAFNMIEITDNNTGKTIGNALCYFVKDKDKNPAFVVDNIEINNSFDITGTEFELRKAITQYASNVSKEVTKNDETPVFMGAKYNDVPIDYLAQSQQEISFLGDINSEIIYLDLFGGTREKSSLTGIHKFFRLK